MRPARYFSIIQLSNARVDKRGAGAWLQHQQAYRRVGSGDQHKNHHMVNFLKNFQFFPSTVYRMVQGTGSVQKNHTAHKNGHRPESYLAGSQGSLGQKRDCGKNCQNHPNKMRNRASRFSDCKCHTATS